MRAVIVLFVVVLGTMLAAPPESKKPIRIGLDWLNSTEMGAEGCKPQSIVLPAGGFMQFKLGSRPGEPGFKLSADWEGEAVLLTMSCKGDWSTKEETVAATLPIGEKRELVVARYKFGVTATEYVEKPKAK